MRGPSPISDTPIFCLTAWFGTSDIILETNPARLWNRGLPFAYGPFDCHCIRLDNPRPITLQNYYLLLKYQDTLHNFYLQDVSPVFPLRSSIKTPENWPKKNCLDQHSSTNQTYWWYNYPLKPILKSSKIYIGWFYPHVLIIGYIGYLRNIGYIG